MNTKQTDAIAEYLEFLLISYVERFERHISDPDVIGEMYSEAYNIITDVEYTLDTQTLFEALVRSNSS